MPRFQITGKILTTNLDRDTQIDAASVADATQIAVLRLGIDPATVHVSPAAPIETQSTLRSALYYLLVLWVIFAVALAFQLFILLTAFAGFGAKFATADVLRLGLWWELPPFVIVGLVALFVWLLGGKRSTGNARD